MKALKVRVPASTANIGPGFDCLGIALQLYNYVTISKGRSTHNCIGTQAAAAFFDRSKMAPFPFSWHIDGDVPRSRGLGSSVTVRLGLLYALNELTGRPLTRYALYRLCSELEGHSDNAAAAAFGGFSISRPGHPVHSYSVAESLFFVILIPAFEVSTSVARDVLPLAVAHTDAVVSSSNAAAIAAAFASKQYDKLADSFDDRMHQPYRERLVPFMHTVINAGRAEGALGGWLSGSGSTIICLTEKSEQSVSNAMLRAVGQENATTIITRADNIGVSDCI